ncbi:MAG: glycine oxidase ThiO, partial [Chloroflexi bacterium]|nr:glycine oxidase ThiO [Chloroflexota bacterium]
ASIAAAGILGSGVEGDHSDHFLNLAVQSAKLYPEFAAELEAVTGLDATYTRSGALSVVFGEKQRDFVSAQARELAAQGERVAWLDADTLRREEPLVNADARGALLLEDSAHVYAPQLMHVLTLAAVAQGVTIHEYTPVHGFLTSGERVTGLQTAAGPVHAAHVVIAAGAWSRLLGDHLGISLPLKPTRGQVMVLETYDRPLRRVVFGAGGYLAPKQDGRIVVGATEEDAGFERENTAGGVAFLVKILQRLAPSLADTRVHHFGVGLRPTPPDGLPLLGPVAARPGLWVAAGHHRNGILLAPITAQLMSNAIRKGDLAPLQPYAPERFAAQ